MYECMYVCMYVSSRGTYIRKEGETCYGEQFCVSWNNEYKKTGIRSAFTKVITERHIGTQVLLDFAKESRLTLPLGESIGCTALKRKEREFPKLFRINYGNS